MIVYVDLEHERIKKNHDLWLRSCAWRLQTKYRLEAISGDHCLVVRYEQISPDLLRELNARAVVVSGCYTDFEHYSEKNLAGLRAVYRQAAWPTLGFCAGLQLMAQTYGARLDAVGPLALGEMDVYAQRGIPGHVPGMKAERGFMPVKINGIHPLLMGLGETAEFFQAHYWELKNMPDGFNNLARSPITPYQLLAHEERPLFGTQFHPEYYDDAHLDGRTLIENFFHLAQEWPVDLAHAEQPLNNVQPASFAVPPKTNPLQTTRTSEEEEIPTS